MNPSIHGLHGGRRRQTGVAALTLAALMLSFCLLLLGGYVTFRSRSVSLGAEEQARALQWAEDATTGFALVNGRLPCPAAERGKAEDCAAGAKGWLPVETLEPFASTALDGKNRLHMLYLLYRGADVLPDDPDLGVVSEGFVPALADGSPVSSYPRILSGADLCGKLRAAFSAPDGGTGSPPRWQMGDETSGSPHRSDRAHVGKAPVTGADANVAYGLAVAAHGIGSGDDRDADMLSPVLSSPRRAHDALYDDMVRAISGPRLYRTLGCAANTASLDALAVAQNFFADADGSRASNIAGGESMTKVQAPVVAGSAVGVVADIADMADSRQAIATAETKKIMATFRLPSPVAAAEILLQEKAIFDATIATGLAGVAIVRGTIGTVIEGVYMNRYQTVAKQADERTSVWAGGTDVLSMADSRGINDQK